ncbi:MAG: FecR domain-containing protein [Saprospiraceae bacterium]|nr:FecR domain-containing protein [Candidatus Defluviibacterium haderslevense]
MNALEYIHKRLSGALNSQEVEVFNAWLDADPRNKSLFEQQKRIWDQSANFGSDLNVDVDKALLLFKSKIATVDQVPKEAKKVSIFSNSFLRIAASILFIFGSVAIWYVMSDNVVTHDQLVQTDGDIKKLTLADNSQITLNEKSSLSYPESFPGRERRVTLKGEAFFAIAKNPEKPFIISTESGEIKVLGTRFNVKETTNPSGIEVLVEEGRVSFQTKSKDAVHILSAGDKLILNNTTSQMLIQHKSNMNDLVWFTYSLEYVNAKLGTVVSDLSKYFKVPIHLEQPCLEGLRFTSPMDLSKNQDVKRIVEILTESLNLKVIPSQTDTIILDGVCQ